MKVHRYDLRLDVDHAGMAYRGQVAIELDHDGGPLLVHAIGLEIAAVRHGSRTLPWKAVPEQEGFQVEGLPAGRQRVEVDFSGKVPESALSGIYRTDYGESPAIVTQLEPCGARRVLPCIDHPAQKAEFHTEVTVDPGLQVIFNTPVLTRAEEGGRTRFRFEPTPRMSTYLLFLGIGKFEERKRRHPDTEIIVACPPGKGDQAEFALEHAGKVLDFFREYFGLPYPLPKLHLVAVPNTAVGGMENWGAIAFRERALLVAPDASPTTKRVVLGVIAHEIAHQWFGDLVTMAWWNDLWLNESFATFMDFKATSHLYPDWEVWSDFATGTSNAQLWDALPHSHPVNVPVEDPNQIAGIFDEISYAKGGSILRMIEAYLGEEVFRRGVSRYLKTFSYGNARGEDLWAALDAEANEPISQVLGDWLDRPGYPEVVVERRGAFVHLSQQQFLLLPPAEPAPAGPGPTWAIPLNVLVDGKAAGHLMRGPSMQLPMSDPSTLVVNHGRRSYLRVRYDGELGRSLRARYRSLAPWDRWGVLQDSYALFLAGRLEPEAYLELVRACHEEDHFLVLSELLQQIGTLYPVLHTRARFAEAVRSTVAHQVERRGLLPRAGEPTRDSVLRQKLVALRVEIDLDFALQMAPRFATWGSQDPGLRAAVAIAYARAHGHEVFDELFERLKGAKTDEEKTRLATALGSFRDPKAIERAISVPWGGEISPTIGLEILVAMGSNPDAYAILWGGLQQFLPFLIENFQGTGIVPLVLQWSTPYLGLGREQEVRAYFEHLDVGEGKSGLTKGFDLLAIYSRLQAGFPATG